MITLLRAEKTMAGCSIPLAVRMHNQPDLDLHRHDFTELVVVLDGAGDHLLDDDWFPIVAGDVFVIDQNHCHGYRNARDLRIANVLFDESFLLGHARTLPGLPGYQALVHLEPTARKRLLFEGKLRLSGDALAVVEERLFTLLAELEERPAGYELRAVSILVELIVLLCRLYGRSGVPPAPHSLTDIARVVSYLERNYQDDVGISDLEELVKMSSRTLIRRFSRATGTTPLQYVLRVRISRALYLLRTTGDSVSTIALRVGFNDPNYFTRQFHQIVGVTPTQYRRAARNHGPTTGGRVYPFPDS